MNITISDKALDYFHDKKLSAISFKRLDQNQGWAGTMTKGAYSPSAPQDAENYQIYPVEGIHVYIDKRLEFTEEEPRIILKNMLFFKEIYITGIKAVDN